MSDVIATPSRERDLCAEFRHILGHFCSGIVVVTGRDANGDPVGMTCQSFFSLSLDPPLVAFSPARMSGSYALIRESGAFCINILAESQQALCATFARRGVDRWSAVRWRPGETRSPILDGVLAWIDCDIEAEHETGDHYLVIGRVRGMDTNENGAGRPLLYFRGSYGALHAGPERAF